VFGCGEKTVDYEHEMPFPLEERLFKQERAKSGYVGASLTVATIADAGASPMKQ